jgi:hypothetical protein
LSYHCIHRSQDAANYRRADEGLDLLYAHRPESRRLVASAEERDTPMGRLHVISVEGLVGFELQGYVNDVSRLRYLDDIRALLRASREALDLSEVRRYFAVFEREPFAGRISCRTRPFNMKQGQSRFWPRVQASLGRGPRMRAAAQSRRGWS